MSKDSISANQFDYMTFITHADQENLDGIMFAADKEKAFDSVEHSFVFATLKTFGFGDSFINWARAFCNSSQSCVMNNGMSTGYFSLKIGTRRAILYFHIFLSPSEATDEPRDFEYGI